MSLECINVEAPRVLSVAIDPSDANVVWAGVEVDGVRRSLDGGETWTSITNGITDPDTHGVVVSTATPKTGFTNTASEIFTSIDMGESWQPMGARQFFPMPYIRSMILKVDDPKVMFCGNGDGPFGEAGTLQRSLDQGHTWETMPLPEEPNTPIWAFAVNRADPDLIFCCSKWGQIFSSKDGGDSWGKVRREFSETRAIAWQPN